MRKLQLLIFLLILPVASSFIFYIDFVRAESHPDSTVTENEKIVVNKDANVQSPKIFFEAPNFDFGKVYKGQKVEHIFKFVNR